MLEGFTPWPPEYVKRYREEGYWEDKTLTEKLDEAIKAVPDKIALVTDQSRVTYREMGERINRLALHFSKLGFKPRDRAVFQMPNIEQFVYTFFGLIKIGVIPIMSLPPHRHVEIGYFLKHSDATGYAIPSEFRRFNYVQMARELMKEVPSLKIILVAGSPVPEGMYSIDEFLSAPIEEENLDEYFKRYRPDPCDVALIHI